MSYTGWDQQQPPPPRGGNRGGQSQQVAPNHKDPVGADELAAYDGAWEQAEVREAGGYANKPDGDYVGQIGVARWERTKAQGTPMLLISMNILAGPSKGEYNHRRVLRDSDAAKYIKQDMANLGLNAPLISQLESYLPNLIDVCVAFTLKSSEKNGKTYQNCFLNRAIDPDDLDAEIARVAAPDTEQVPF